MIKILVRLHQFIGNVCHPPHERQLLDTKLEQVKLEVLKHQTFLRWSLLDDIRLLHEYSKAPLLRCPLCRKEGEKGKFQEYRSHCIFLGGDLIRFQCPSCDVIFGDQKMLAKSDDALAAEYEWHYSLFSEGDSKNAEIRAFHSLNPEKEGVYINFGAGAWSGSVAALRHQGWNVYGYEPHSSAINADEEYIIRGRDQLQGMQFDGIFSNNVLEHLRHPVEELRFLKSLLKPDASMAHATACFAYLYEYTRFHLFFYLGRSRKLLAQEAGLEIKEYICDDEFMCLVLGR